MSLANMKRPGFWYALIWKDVYQLKQITSYLAVGLLALQAILLLSCILGPQAARPDSMVFQWVIAGTGLIIFLLAAPAMTAGHERQVGTWTWQSSLPQSWLHSLTSKIAATGIVGSLFGAALCVLPVASLLLYRSVELSVTASSPERLWGILIFVLVALEVAAVSMLGSLLFRETLNGILAIGAGVIVLQMLVYGAVLEQLPQNAQPGLLVNAAMWTQLIGFPLVLIATSVAVYRWRWTTGQFASLSLRRSTVTEEAVVRTAARTRQPSLWQSQFSLAMRLMLPLRIATLAIFGLVVIIGVSNRFVPEFVLAFGGFACFLFGLTAFGCDQPPRTSFLADQGPIPKSIFWSRVLASGAFALALYGIVVALILVANQEGTPVVLLITSGLTSASYALGVYGSIKFRTMLVALAAGFIVFMGVAISASMAATAENVLSHQVDHMVRLRTANDCYNAIGVIICCCMVTAPLILLFATYRSVKPWLVLGQPSGAAWYPGVCLLAISVPVFLGATFGFLVFPSTTQARIDAIISTTDKNPAKSAYADALRSVHQGRKRKSSRLAPIGQYYPPIRWAIERELVNRYELIPEMPQAIGISPAPRVDVETTPTNVPASSVRSPVEGIEETTPDAVNLDADDEGA